MLRVLVESVKISAVRFTFTFNSTKPGHDLVPSTSHFLLPPELAEVMQDSVAKASILNRPEHGHDDKMGGDAFQVRPKHCYQDISIGYELTEEQHGTASPQSVFN
jgi:hypothetical protein